MVFSAEEYIDKQFLQFQGFIAKLSSSTPVLTLTTIKDEKQLIRALVNQNKAYAKKILDLFEELSNEGQSNGQKGHIDALNTSKSFELQSGTNPRNSTQFEEDKLSKDTAELSQLERKVDYLNALYMQTKKQNEEKDTSIKALNQQIQDINAEKERIENDLQELMDEFAQVKDKYEEQTRDLKDMEKYIADLKKKGPGKETPLKTAVEHERIPELNEEIEELKEKLEQKEKAITELRAQMADLTPKRAKVVEVKPEVKHDDTPQLQQLQEKVLDTGLRLRELRTLLQRLCVKVDCKVEERTVSSPTRLRKDKLGAEDIGDILEKEHVGIIEGLRRMAVDLLNQPVRPATLTRSNSRTESSPKRRKSFGSSRKFREELEIMNEEIKQKTRITFETFARKTRDELVVQLEEEVEANRILKDKVEKLSFTLQSVLLAVQDDLDRLSLIHEYARKSTTAEEFRHQIQACKSKVEEMLTPEVREDMTLSEEYEKQRRLWQEKNESQARLFKEDLLRLREEIENQKQMTLDQEKELNGQIDGIKREFEEARIQHAEEVEQFEEKVAYLEREQENLSRYLEELKRGKAEVENILSEREEMIINYSKSISEWQVKCGYLETDIRKALNEKTKMQDLVFEKDKEIENLKSLKSELQSNVRSLNATIESLERNQARNEQEISAKTKRIEDLQATLQEEQRKWIEMNDQIKTEYKEYVEETERTTEDLKENYERLISEYNSQLEDLRRYSEQLKRGQENQLENHGEEIRRLTQINEEVSERARVQVDAIRIKEDRIIRLEEDLRKLEFKARTMEDALTEMNAIKEKNKKYFELLSTSNVELNSLKIESQTLLAERNDALDKATKIEKGYIDIREELRKTIEKNERLKEAIQEHQAELRALKDELDKSHRKLMEKEKELRSVNEEYLTQSRTTIGYKDETINRLKIDLKQVTSDYESLRREYQDIIERNEESLLENEKLKQIVFDKELNFNEIEKLNNLNDELLVQNEQLKAERRRMEEESEREKRSLVLEINTLKSRSMDLQSSLQKRSK